MGNAEHIRRHRTSCQVAPVHPYTFLFKMSKIAAAEAKGNVGDQALELTLAKSTSDTPRLVLFKQKWHQKCTSKHGHLLYSKCTCPPPNYALRNILSITERINQFKLLRKSVTAAWKRTKQKQATRKSKR